MNQMQLNNGMTLPGLELGMYLSENGEETKNAIKWAFEAGYRHIDTATFYGNEESIGLAIKETSLKREDFFLTTKLWKDDVRNGRTKEAFDLSLSKLQTDYIDLYLIHYPADGFEQSWNALEELYQEGKIKAIGVSNFHQRHLEALEAIARVPVAVNQIESHPYFTNLELIAYCQERNIVVQSWRPLGGPNSDLLNNQVLCQLGKKYEKSPAQIILRWNVDRNVIVIPKSTNQKRIQENIDIFDFQLSMEDIETINGLNTGIRLGPDPDNFPL